MDNTPNVAPHPADAPGESQQPTKELPSWAFWHYELGAGKVLRAVIEPYKYLAFLEQAGFRTFTKQGETTIVLSEDDSMTYTDRRINVFPHIKAFIIETLIDAEFEDVANSMLSSGRFFSIDTLELLPPIDKTAARNSIFSTVETEVTFDMETPDETVLI